MTNLTIGLINTVYPIGSLYDRVTGDFFSERAILAVTNLDVADINHSVVCD